MQNSPGGSIFPYFYKDGELFGVHFGSFFSDEDRLIKLIQAEKAFFLKQNRTIPVWIDFYETRLTDIVLGEFIDYLKSSAPRIPKLGIVGCSLRDKGRINKLIKNTAELSSLIIKYYNDPEEAKTWLVSERE